MLHLLHIPAQVAGIIVVTCCEEVWQHCLETVLLEEEVTVPLSGQEHERQQRRLDKAVQAKAVWAVCNCVPHFPSIRRIVTLELEQCPKSV